MHGKARVELAFAARHQCRAVGGSVARWNRVSFDAAAFAGLTLENGWTNYGSGTANAAASISSGIVTLAGAITTTGTDPVAFTLATPFRPATTVYVPVDMCNATNGRLVITTDGVVTVQAESSFSNAACFTSLDGASFATTKGGFTALTLENGWTNYGNGTANAAVKNVSGIVHFEGAISTTGTDLVAFTLPAAFWPATTVYVPVDLCNANNGRLVITTSGVVSVQAEGAFSDAACFTSLDGVSFALTAAKFKALTLQNGWTNYGNGTANAAVKNLSGIVAFQGAITTTGTNPTTFTLPKAFRPATTVYVQVDMCNATNGRLIIFATGVASVQAEGAFSNAQCFTSLDGVSFDT